MTVVLWLRPPPVPVILIVAVTSLAFAPAVTVNVAPVVAGFGLKLAVTPDGSPPTLSVTGELKVPIGVIVTAYVVD